MGSTVRVKQEDPERDSYITLKVVSQLNELDPYFRVRRDEPLQQLMMRWSGRAGVDDYRTFRFLFDGDRVPENETADEFGLLDGDSIDAMHDQDGGGMGTDP
ncbi:small ubiquitin-related modifier 2-like [Cynara cardunculus var. scolymus]|uniref:small ubiquitin-related modifier 2-like n=1 Tax=Cynara cardunculus var. scolymus TaxID=59895 RepID=UPI000D62DE8B|nr:small ubiquitin-related modifier 2-like [Cynara cardunculus var. scolymus]